MELKRSDCLILPLVLKKKWYDMIASGIKWQEYRNSPTVCRMIERWRGEYYMLMGRKKQVVTFFLGYQKDRPSMSFLVDLVTYENQCTHPEWGEPEGKHCVIDIDNREQVTLVEG